MTLFGGAGRASGDDGVGSGSEVDESIPFDSAEGEAFAALIGEANAGLVAKVAELDAQSADLAARVEELETEAIALKFET